MKIVILGAGIIGVTTAYQLMKRGHEVTVIDRQSASAAECSFANGGQLSYSHAEPWANPNILQKIPLWLIKKNSPLVFNIRLDPPMWMWSLKFLVNCYSKSVKENTRNMMRLSLYSKECFKEMDNDLDLEYSKKDKGTIHVFSSQKTFKHHIKQAEFQKSLGCDFEILSDRNACEKIEPALKNSPAKIVGGIYFPMDATGDVHKFTTNLTNHLKQQGVKFEYDTTVEEILTKEDKIIAIKTDKGIKKANSYIVTLGAHSRPLMEKIGITIPLYPMKGYSISVKVNDKKRTPTIGVTNPDNKIVFSRLGDVLRAAGTAEFAGYDSTIRENRIETLKEMVQGLFPYCGDFGEATSWSCLRPSTPGGNPIIGGTKFRNLFLNTGHGTLGWTLSCGSAKIIADIIDNKLPEIDMSGLTI